MAAGVVNSSDGIGRNVLDPRWYSSRHQIRLHVGELQTAIRTETDFARITPCGFATRCSTSVAQVIRDITIGNRNILFEQLG